MDNKEINSLPLFGGIAYEEEKPREQKATDGLIKIPEKEVTEIQEVGTANNISAQQSVEHQEQIINNQLVQDVTIENQVETISNNAVTEPSVEIVAEQQEKNDITAVATTGNDILTSNAETTADSNSDVQAEIIEDDNTEDSAKESTNALQVYADKINVPIEYLTEKWKVTANADGDISIPYFDENEELIDTKIIDKNNQFSWEQGKEPLVYGEWRLSKYTDEYIVIVPDEQNAHVLWTNSIQAIGVTKTVLSVELGVNLENFKEIYVLRNGADFTDVLFSRLQNILNKNKLYSIDTQNYNYTDFVELNVNGTLSLDTIKKQKFKLVPIPPAESKVTEHVAIAQKVIDKMKLVSYEGELYTYKNGVYYLVRDKEIISHILKFIKPEAKSSLCKQVIHYIRHTLDDAGVEVNHDVANYRNGLLDLINRKFIKHTPDIFTINQLAIDYIEIEMPNVKVDKYLKEICNNNAYREIALLQKLGYCLTTRNDIQKFFIFFGATGSNGKSFTLKVLEKMVNICNVSHKGMELLAEGFEVKGIKGKQLNISFELPVTKIKDTSVLKATTTGDTVETKVKFNPDTLIITSYVKHLFATNYLPEVADKTNGFYRRADIQLFDNQFDPADTSFNEQEFLTQENLNYLGRRAIDEYLKMVDSGRLEFANQEESNKYIREFENLNDSVKAFLSQEDIFPENQPFLIPRPQCWNIYKLFCADNSVAPVGKHQFYTELTTKYGFYIKKNNQGPLICRDPKSTPKANN